MGKTTIEWTSYQKPDGTVVPGYTFNPVIGCAKKSPGCKFCYAEHDTPARVARGQGLELWGADAARKPASESYWRQPHAWNRAAQRDGAPRLVFVASQSDWLEDRPEWEAPRARLLKTILETPNLIWLLLSKEPWNWERLTDQAADYLVGQGLIYEAGQVKTWQMGLPAFPNVRLGVSVENQEWADKRRNAFSQLPGSKFVSYEPALGPADWKGWEFVDQIISGGESGKDPDIRPTHPDWHRATRDWCKRNKKAFFFKQHGEWRHAEIPGPIFNASEIAPQNLHTFPDGLETRRVGKKAAGRLLDGREWNEIPGINFSLEAVNGLNLPTCRRILSTTGSGKYPNG